MKASEARQKWCPFARVSFHCGTDKDMADKLGNAQSYNRLAWIGDMDAAPPESRCIAERCMAWNQSYENPLSGYCKMMAG
jgi:hypothetical protein